MPMSIYAREDEKVVLTHPNNGYDYDKLKANKYLKLGEVYTVSKTVVNGWTTDVYLKEIPDVSFNSVQFEEFR